MEQTTQVAAYNTELEADLAVARLADAGIDSLISADNLGGTFPMMQMITGGFKVQVRTGDEDRAREVLSVEYQPIESPDLGDPSSREQTPEAESSDRGARVRLAIYVVLTIAAAVAVIWSTTQGTL
jgi:hypothetical protein